MNPYLKALIGTVLVAFIGLTVWVVQSIPEPSVDDEVKQHIMKYDGNTIVETKDGRVVWELTADTIEVVAETKIVTLNNVKCRYFTEDGRVLELKGDAGIFSEATDDIELRDNVAGQSTDGYELSCKKLSWIAKDEKMVLSGDVVIKNNVERLLAKGDVAEATDEFKKLKLQGKAHLSKNAPDFDAEAKQ